MCLVVQMIDLRVRVYSRAKVGKWLNFVYVYDTEFHEEGFIVKVLLLAAG
jgi:hypothetical protein